jgi:hypothetical protein
MKKVYTRPSRYNPSITLEQYKTLLERRENARANKKRINYRPLAEEWGRNPMHLASALHRGIKQYDYILWKKGELQ